MPNPKLETYKNKATGDVYDYTDAAAQAALAGILDGTDIESFSDVETALATKVDKVTGKGLSTNDYDNTEKAKVAGAFPRSEQAVLGAKNIWDDSIALSSNASATVTKTTDGYAIQTNTTANSGGQFNQISLRTRYTPFGNITVSFEYKSDIACAGYIGGSDVTLATDWTKVSYSVDGSTMGAICFYNRDTTKTPLIEMRNMMITLATDTDLSFVPPAMTNSELTVKVTPVSGSVSAVEGMETAFSNKSLELIRQTNNTVNVRFAFTAGAAISAWTYFAELSGVSDASPQVRFVLNGDDGNVYPVEIVNKKIRTRNKAIPQASEVLAACVTYVV